MGSADVDTPWGNDMIKILKIEKDGNILRVTLNRPERRNALSTPICTGLIDLQAQVGTDMNIRCVVITGAGESFVPAPTSRNARKETNPDVQNT